MKRLTFLLFPIIVFAQGANTVSVSQSSEIAQLMNLYRAYNKKNDLADGYRLQIMFSNDRSEAYTAKSKIYKQFPHESCYVIYEQPYYKLRVGDFTNRFEATDLLNQMLSTYVGAFIVKDKVKIK
jgi:hypothetical protein